MKRLEIPEFTSYDEESAFWDSLDTGDFMQDDGKWFRFETPAKRAVRIAVLPDIAEVLAQRAHAQGMSVETLANFLLAESMSRPVAAG